MMWKQTTLNKALSKKLPPRFSSKQVYKFTCYDEDGKYKIHIDIPETAYSNEVKWIKERAEEYEANIRKNGFIVDKK